MTTYTQRTMVKLPDQTIQRTLRAWSRTLELDQTSGDSIVTQSDLNRLIRVLSEYSATARSKGPNIPLFQY